MLLRRRGAEKRESYRPVSLHPFSGVFVLRCRHLGGFWISWTAPTERPRQVHFVVFPVVPLGRHRNCLGDVPVFAIEPPPTIHPVISTGGGYAFALSERRNLSSAFKREKCDPISRSRFGKSRAGQAIQQNRENHQREDHIHTVAFDGKSHR